MLTPRIVFLEMEDKRLWIVYFWAEFVFHRGRPKTVLTLTLAAGEEVTRRTNALSMKHFSHDVAEAKQVSELPSKQNLICNFVFLKTKLASAVFTCYLCTCFTIVKLTVAK